ncbi:S1C family serine protease [Ornithinicoccus halotolerans]|uniref:S1C family serine protease n=1 Tax=Ornithinicoccus halotolerans TaxID=1748220 RepID=UPI001E3C6990|nr:trypsin-like peptidase domain-containing protein [Ornithinicoccus halotolerans]
MTLVPVKAATRRRGGLIAAGVALVLLLALLLGIVGGLLGSYLGWRLAGGDSPEVVEPMAVGSASSGGGGDVAPVTEIARTSLPSVVLISAGEGRAAGVGSGFVIREDGYIVTNAHVVSGAGAEGLTVEFADDSVHDAEVVGQDTSYDIAVLRVDVGGLPALPFGDSDRLEVGEPVVAVGAPLGLDSTVTSGIVSARDRPVSAGDPQNPSYINAIQTDAAINPGNSGGPLLDHRGRVVGVNSAIAQLPDGITRSGSIGLGFAIPSNQVRRTADQLIETGQSQHPVIGVLVDLSYTGQGARVLPESTSGDQPVVPGGPADQAGIEPGEVILAIDEQRIDDSRHLIVVLRSYSVGDVVELTVRGEDGTERTVEVTLQGSSQ